MTSVSINLSSIRCRDLAGRCFLQKCSAKVISFVLGVIETVDRSLSISVTLELCLLFLDGSCGLLDVWLEGVVDVVN